ncbi:MAG: ribonuclease H family protein [Colwellia sp.]|nr:ribonuclease H family protein [Colwellia sp.]MCW8865867.1 ribonuclease H family protein [Colwellia sp.]MCW9080325.1 ribonuclease H family protein [Colwellia sp.]
MSKKFYVVWKGAKTGVFSTWAEVQSHTQGRSDAQFMGFPSKAEAEAAFASTYTKALMKRSLSNKKPTTQSKTTSQATKTAAQSASADVQIYCDGACSPNPGKSGTGLALYQQNKPSALYYGLYNANGTNNTAELNGLLMSFKLAQKQLQTTSKVQILSDSKYSIDCITKWAKGWQAKGWTRGKGEEIKNVTLIKECFALYQTLKNQLIITHVRGHADIEGNELADRMAVLARKEQQKSLVKYQGALDIKAILAMESG